LFALGVAEFYTNIFNGVVMVAAILFGNLSAFVALHQRVRMAAR
jgi:ribose transport system permease protein